MAFTEIEEKKPKYISELPKDEWVTGKLTDISLGTPGKHSNQYTLETDGGKELKFYGCSKIDNSINTTHINKMVRFMYKGKVSTEGGFQYSVRVQVDNDSTDLSNASNKQIMDFAEGQ